MCNKVKTKANIIQQYLLCLVVYQKIATKTIGNYVLSSLNISGVKNVNIEVGTMKKETISNAY